MSLGARLSAAVIVSLVVVTVIVGGCEFLPTSVGLRTAPAPAQACMDALIGGTLVRHAPSGLGITDADGQTTTVVWPFGYSARDEGGRIALVDERGQVVAHVGDEIQVGGGFGDVWYACGPVSVVVPDR